MQEGGSEYGVSPEMASFGGLAEAASPIRSLPPARENFNELEQMTGGFPDEDSLVGEEGEKGVTGNRWPRQETLALLKIRSDMNAAFSDATLKGPLWEDVSRKLAKLGYNRSAKKCKEKFENLHKYYKRTKDGRAGRQDGKSYRFFSHLEALQSSSNTPTTTAAAAAAPMSPAISGSNPMVVSSSSRIQPPPVSAPAAATTQIKVQQNRPDLSVETRTGVSGLAAAGISFSSNTSSSSSDSGEEMEEEGPSTGTRKRKRSGSGGGSRKMMGFLEGLMRQAMEKQEAMQQRFLEAIEKREKDRMIRDEAWKRQEMTKLAREHEIIAQERAMSASRDAVVITLLQNLTGQTFQIPQLVTISAAPEPQPPSPPTPVPQQQQQQDQQQKQEQHQSHKTENSGHQLSSSEVVVAHQQEMGGNFDPVSSSRWPKSEVFTLIKLRSELESRYQEIGPKGPLWEELSSRMQQLGFNRSAKRCKEKWENINKYFKKVKESNKKRPEDAKTCPYFHQLDALYRKKILSSSGIQNNLEQDMNQNPNPQEGGDVLGVTPATETKSSNTSNKNCQGGSALQLQTSNGGSPPSFFEEDLMKKPEDIVKKLMEQQQQAVIRTMIS